MVAFAKVENSVQTCFATICCYDFTLFRHNESRGFSTVFRPAVNPKFPERKLFVKLRPQYSFFQCLISDV